MFGTGSVSLKENKRLTENIREQGHFSGTNSKISIYTNPVVLKKRSRKECVKVAQRLQVLKHRENIRLRVIISIFFSLLIVMFLFFINNL